MVSVVTFNDLSLPLKLRRENLVNPSSSRYCDVSKHSVKHFATLWRFKKKNKHRAVSAAETNSVENDGTKKNEQRAVLAAERNSVGNDVLLADDPEFEEAFGDYIKAMEDVCQRRTRNNVSGNGRTDSTGKKGKIVHTKKRRLEASKGEAFFSEQKAKAKAKLRREMWENLVKDSKSLNRKPFRGLFLVPSDVHYAENSESDAGTRHKAFEFLSEATEPQLNLESRVRRLADRYMYTTVLSILGKASRPKEALVVFNAMRDDFSTYPDMASYHSIAVTLGQAGYIRELVDLMDTLRRGPDKDILKLPLRNWNPCLHPDVVVYNALINACAQRKQWRGANWVLKKMHESGTKPNDATYGLVMEVMLNAQKFDLVSSYFAKMLNAGMTPSVLTYKVLVQAFCKDGKVDKAIHVVSEMEKKGMVGTAGLYYELACGLCTAGRCIEALSLVDKIQKVGGKPVYVAYTGLIQASLKSGFVRDSIFIFDEMKKSCTPNIDACNVMLKLYAQNNMMTEMKNLYQQIKNGSVSADCMTDGNVMIKPDINTYHTVLKASAAINDWDYFEAVCEDMFREGAVIKSETLTKLIVAASRAGKRDLLKSAYGQFTRSGAIPHISICKELVLQSIESQDYSSACKYLQKMAKAHMNADKSDWMQLLKRSKYAIHKENFQQLLVMARDFHEKNQTNMIFSNFINGFSAIADQYM
eukprot:TRINITY_DN947_c0_g1_i1.p1 TRINITY_DN947_c0_g1~~TRINITY_DN947_c0_g1_i1.p1  ORF type:complete len:699 (+),score=126.29 TRINITY_DN947_c0_g1_i1:119-2215(+)